MGKVLLVEDDNNLREIFEMRLQAEGYDTVTASDGEEALAVASKERPSLIIADVMMPKLSGFEMLETLRASPEMASTKVVMMTALGQAEDRARGEKLGVVKYLVKSQVTLEDFVRVVREVLPPDQAASAAQPDAATTPANAGQHNNSNLESEKSMDNSTPSNQPAPQPSDGGSMGTPPAGDMPGSAGQMSTEEEKKEMDSQVNSFASGAPSMPSSSPAGDSPAAPAGDAPAGDSGFGGAAPSSDAGMGSSPAPTSGGMPSADPAAPSGDAGAASPGTSMPGEAPKADEHKDSSADTTL